MQAQTCTELDLTKIQLLLDKGQNPKDIAAAGAPLDSLYGKTYQRGLIYFVNTTPSQYPNFTGVGLVCTPTDYGNFDPWGGNGIVTGATGKEVGDGPANTQKILDATCATPPRSTNICKDLILEGYDDWFLPSIGEVDLIYHNLHLKGHSNFLGNIQRYQSSTEQDANNFTLRLFFRDTIAPVNKISGDDIRPSRIF